MQLVPIRCADRINLTLEEQHAAREYTQSSRRGKGCTPEADQAGPWKRGKQAKHHTQGECMCAAGGDMSDLKQHTTAHMNSTAHILRACAYIIARYPTKIRSAPMTRKVKNLPPLLEVLNPTKKYTTGAKMMEQTTCQRETRYGVV